MEARTAPADGQIGTERSALAAIVGSSRPAAPQQVTQRLFEVGMTEPVPGVVQAGGDHALTRAGELAGALVAEQHPGPQRWYRQHCGPAQNVGEAAGVVDVAE